MPGQSRLRLSAVAGAAVARVAAAKGCENLPDVDEEVMRFVPGHGHGEWDYDYDDVLDYREVHL